MPPMLPRSRVGTLTIQETYEENLTAAHSLPSAVWTGLGVFEVPTSIGSVELCDDPVHNWVGWVATLAIQDTCQENLTAAHSLPSAVLDWVGGF